MSSLPFNLVGSFDDIDARLVVQVELDARTGEIVSITGDRQAIRETCSFLLQAVGTPGTRHGLDQGDGNRPIHGLGAHPDSSGARGNGPLLDTATNKTALVDAVDSDDLSDQDIRECARPANILAALRQGRPILSAAPRPIDDECERELRSTSTSLETSARERELPAEVARRDERTMECDPLPSRSNSDARSGGNGNAAGPGPEVPANHRDLVSRRDALEAGAPDAFPPRSPGEGHLARGFSGDPQGNDGDETHVRGDSPVGGASEVVGGDVDDRNAALDAASRESDVDDAGAHRGAGRGRSEWCRRSRRTFVTGHGGRLRLVPAPLWEPDTAHDTAADR